MLHEELTHEIIKAFYEVHKILGFGFFVQALRVEHEWQLINYLKATGLEVGLLLNFGHSAEFKRKVFTK